MFNQGNNKALARFLLLFFIILLPAFVSGCVQKKITTQEDVNAFASGEQGEESGKMLQLQGTLTTKDGLASDHVMAMLEDSKGILWFGTARGLTRYDGKTFRNFTKKDGLVGNIVGAIFEDSKGNLWFGTDSLWHGGGSGVSRYDGKTFRNFSKKEGLPGDNINDIFEDKEDGNIWFATDAGTSFYDGKMFHSMTSGFAHNEQWNNDSSVSAIAQDEAGYLWFGGSGGITYHGDTVRHFTTDDGLRTGGVKDMLFDKKGVLWIARTGGGDSPLTRYDGKSFDNLPKSEGLPSSMALTIMQDKKGNIWFGTPLGVSVYDGKTFRSYDEKDGLPHNGLGVTHHEDVFGRRSITGKGVSAIVEDRNGTLWFATLGGGVSRGVF